MWPTEVLELFGIQLSGGVLASFQGFDGTSNLLTLTRQSGQSDRDINSIILGALQKGQIKPSLKLPANVNEEKKDLEQKQTQPISSNKAAEQTQSTNVEKPALDDQTLPLSVSLKHEEPGEELNIEQNLCLQDCSNVCVYRTCVGICSGPLAMKFWCTGAVPPGVLSCNSKVLFKRSLVIISRAAVVKHLLCLISENVSKTKTAEECAPTHDTVSSVESSCGGYYCVSEIVSLITFWRGGKGAHPGQR